MVIVNPDENTSFYVDGYLKNVLDSYKSAVHNKNISIVICIDGKSGMGKTTLSNQLSKYVYPKYSLSNIYFEPESFLQGLSNAEPESCHVFDEAMLISSRSAMSAINRMIIQAMTMIRSKKIFIIFNINSIFDLDRNLVLSRADILLHCYGDSIVDRGNFCAFFKSKGGEDRLKKLYFMGKKFYSYSKPKANFYGRFYKPFILDEIEYEKKKQEGVNNFLRGDVKFGKSKLVEAKLIKYLKDVIGLKAEEIGEIAGITFQSVYNKLNLLKFT